MTIVIGKHYAAWYNEAIQFYDDDKLYECIETARNLLADSGCPRFFRMKSLVLLGHILGEWREANECYIQAESLWRIVRPLHAVGEDEKVDKALTKLRKELDDLKELLEEDSGHPSGYDADESVKPRVAAYHARVEREKADAIATNTPLPNGRADPNRNPPTTVHRRSAEAHARASNQQAGAKLNAITCDFRAMDFDKILQETLEIQRQANVAWAAGKKELFDDGGLTLTALGCGTMGIAILGGIMHALNNPTSTPGDEPTPEKLPTKFRACVRSRRSALRVQEELGKYDSKLSLFERENLKAVQGSDVILLGCKPYMLKDVLCEEGLREALAGKLLISVLAGVSVEDIHQVLYPTDSPIPSKCTIIRAVPNTAAAVRESMTVIAISNPPLPTETDALITWMFTRIGRVLRLPESNMNLCSSLCGSGPAFVALMAESMAAGAIAMGCPREEAYIMAAQTMRGTTQLLLQQGEHPAVLRDKVSTPGGCTVAGLQVLEDGAVRGCIARAVKEATVVAGRLGPGQVKIGETGK